MPHALRRHARPVLLAALALLAACSSSSATPKDVPAEDSGGHVTKDAGMTSHDGSMSKADAATKHDAGGSTGMDAMLTDTSTGSDSGYAPPLVLPAPTATITWGDRTVFLDQTQASLLKTVDDPVAIDGGTTQSLTFDKAGLAAANLDLSAGKIVVVYGQVMRLITATSTDSAGNLVVETADTSLEDAASDADLEWEQASELTPAAVMAAIKDPTNHLKMHHDLTVSRGVLSFTASSGAYNFDIHLTLHGDTADVNITITKSGGNEKFTVTGMVGRSVTTNKIKVVGHKLQSYSTDSADVNGTLTLAVVAAGSGTDSLSYDIPVPIFSFPFLVGPIPVVESLSAQFVVNGSVTVMSSVNVSAEFQYNADLGVSYASGAINTTGTMGNPMITETKQPQSASAGDVAFSAGLGFPRLSLSFFAGSLVGWMQPAFVAGGTYTAFPACQTANAEFLASCGYDISILGKIPVASGSKVLFMKNKTLLSSGAACPDAGM